MLVCKPVQPVVVCSMCVTQVIVSYTRGDRNKWQKKEVGRVNVSNGPILPRTTISWSKERIPLPPLPPSGLKDTKIIGLKYILEVLALYPTLRSLVSSTYWRY